VDTETGRYHVIGGGRVVEEAVVPGQRSVAVERAEAAVLRLVDARTSTDDVRRRRRRHRDAVALPHEPRTAIHVDRVHVVEHRAADISGRSTLVDVLINSDLLLSSPTTHDFNSRLNSVVLNRSVKLKLKPVLGRFSFKLMLKLTSF